MNILLIGNGFDLAHGLPTRYIDFYHFCNLVLHIRECFNNSNFTGVSELINSENIFNREVDSKVMDYLKRLYAKNNNFFLEEQYFIELFELIDINLWFDYFTSRYLKGIISKELYWMDFEMEISEVVKTIDELLVKLKEVGNPNEFTISFYNKVKDLGEAFFGNENNMFIKENLIEIIDDLISALEEDLRKICRAIEIYLCLITENIKGIEKLSMISSLDLEYLISFNYTNTYENLYDNSLKVKYCYIHGKANINNNVESNNLVLGIDEYLDDYTKNTKVELISFKKYYQRILNSTDSNYLQWLNEIDEKSKEIISFNRISGKYYDNEGIDEYKTHLHIYGHSLDITDRDVISKLILHENFVTHIYYYEKSKNDKSALKRIVKNLVMIIGQDELIKRRGSDNLTIQFIPISSSN